MQKEKENSGQANPCANRADYDQFLAVSGGQTTVAGVVQAIQQEAVCRAAGRVGGGGGTVIETFVAAITQVATTLIPATSTSP